MKRDMWLGLLKIGAHSNTLVGGERGGVPLSYEQAHIFNDSMQCIMYKKKIIRKTLQNKATHV